VSWEEIAKLAPIGTLIIASGALCVATWSLLAQKAVARRRERAFKDRASEKSGA
jgi:hypothetical protein